MSSESLTSGDASSALGTIFTGTQYIQLHLSHPGAAGTAGIASNNTRQSLTWSAVGSPPAGHVQVANAADILWTTVPATETYLYFSVWSLSSGGTFHGSGAVSGGAVNSGQDFKIPAGSLIFDSTVAS